MERGSGQTYLVNDGSEDCLNVSLFGPFLVLYVFSGLD
jgi:lipocalin